MHIELGRDRGAQTQGVVQGVADDAVAVHAGPSLHPRDESVDGVCHDQHRSPPPGGGERIGHLCDDCGVRVQELCPGRHGVQGDPGADHDHVCIDRIHGSAQPHRRRLTECKHIQQVHGVALGHGGVRVHKHNLGTG